MKVPWQRQPRKTLALETVSRGRSTSGHGLMQFTKEPAPPLGQVCPIEHGPLGDHAGRRLLEPPREKRSAPSDNRLQATHGATRAKTTVVSEVATPVSSTKTDGRVAAGGGALEGAFNQRSNRWTREVAQNKSRPLRAVPASPQAHSYPRAWPWQRKGAKTRDTHISFSEAR